MTWHKHTCIFKKFPKTILTLAVCNALLIFSILLFKKLAMAHKNWFHYSLMICDPQFENYFFYHMNFIGCVVPHMVWVYYMYLIDAT